MPRQKTEAILLPVCDVVDEICKFANTQRARPSRRTTEYKGAVAWRNEIIPDIEKFIKTPPFTIDKKKNAVKSNVFASMLAARSLMFLDEHSRVALRTYEGGLLSRIRGFLLEFTERRGAFKTKYPFPVKELDRFASWLTNEWIVDKALMAHATSKRPPRAHMWLVSSGGRGFLLGLFVHIASILGNLVADCVRNEEADASDRKDAVAIVGHVATVKPTVESNPAVNETADAAETENDVGIPTIRYDWPTLQKDWFRGNIWDEVIEIVSIFAQHVVEQYLGEAKEVHAGGKLAGLVFGAPGKMNSAVFNVESLMRPRQFYKTLMEVNTASVSLGVSVGQLAFRILCHYDALQPSDVLSGNIHLDVYDVVTKYVDNMRDVVRMTSSRKLNKHSVKIGFSRKTWCAKVVAELKVCSGLPKAAVQAPNADDRVRGDALPDVQVESPLPPVPPTSTLPGDTRAAPAPTVDPLLSAAQEQVAYGTGPQVSTPSGVPPSPPPHEENPHAKHTACEKCGHVKKQSEDPPGTQYADVDAVPRPPTPVDANEDKDNDDEIVPQHPPPADMTPTPTTLIPGGRDLSARGEAILSSFDDAVASSPGQFDVQPSVPQSGDVTEQTPSTTNTGRPAGKPKKITENQSIPPNATATPQEKPSDDVIVGKRRPPTPGGTSSEPPWKKYRTAPPGSGSPRQGGALHAGNARTPTREERLHNRNNPEPPIPRITRHSDKLRRETRNGSTPVFPTDTDVDVDPAPSDDSISRSFVIEGKHVETDFKVMEIIHLWTRRLQFSKGRVEEPTRWLDSCTSWGRPSSGKNLSANGSPVPHYKSIQEYCAIWQVILVRSIYTALEDIATKRFTWDTSNTDVTYIGCYDVVAERSQGALFHMEVRYTVKRNDDYGFSNGDIVLVQPLDLDDDGTVLWRYNPLLMYVECVKERQEGRNVLRLQLMALGIDGTVSEGHALGGNRRVTNADVWVRGNIFGDIASSQAVANLTSAPQTMQRMLVGLKSSSEERRGRGDIFKLTEDMSASSRDAAWGKYLSNVVQCPNATFYLRGTVCFPGEAQARYEMGTPSLNMSHGIAIAEALRCCYGTNVDAPYSRSNDAAFGVVGPAGTGKTTLVSHLIGCLMSSTRLVADLVKIEELRQDVFPNPSAFGGARLAMKPLTSRTTEFLEKARCEPKDAPPPPEQTLSILVATSTHAALNEIEKRLQDGINVATDGSGFFSLTPQYRRLTRLRAGKGRASRDDEGSRLSETREAIFPEWMLRKYNGCITLTTFGSVWCAFDEQLNLKGRANPFQQYDIIIVDEASLVRDSEYFRLFVALHTPTNNTRRGPSIIFVGDPAQLGPVVNGRPAGDTADLMEIERLSLFERLMCTSASVEKRDCSMDFVMLNVEYRMYPVISRLANIISNRFVTSHHTNVHGRGKWLQYNDPSFNVGYMENCNYGFIARPVAWVDPYIHARRTEDGGSQDWAPLLEGLRPNYENVFEARTILELLTVLLHNNVPMDSIAIITPYNQQRKLLERALPFFLKNRHMISRETDFIIPVVTVTSMQGQEKDCVIVSPCLHDPVYGSDRQKLSNSLGIVGDTKALYVTITRAKTQLIFVGDSNRLARSSASWKSVVDYCLAKH